MQNNNVAIAAVDFWEMIAKPSVIDFYDSPNDFRKLVISVWSMDALVEHVCWEYFSDQMEADHKGFLKKLADECVSYGNIHEAANSLKHAVRSGKSARTAGSKSVDVRIRGWGVAEYGVDEWGGTSIALVDFLDRRSASIKYSMKTLEVWVAEQFSKSECAN